MVRTQVQLTEEQMAALKKLATERGASVAQLVREGVNALLQASRGLSREERLRRAREVPSFPGPADLSERHDDYFVESVLE
jgi:hypothetical protein